MHDSAKPNFASWERSMVDRLCQDIWDDNVALRAANEQLRLTNKDLSALLRKQFMQEDDMR